MPKPNPNNDLRNVPTDMLMTYYEHQYSRMKQLEDQRINITNITVTLSVIALTFGFNTSDRFSRTVGYALLATMIFTNLFAIAYIAKTRSWISTHRNRAKGVLEKRSKELFKFDQETHDERVLWIPGRGRIQMFLHILLLLVAIALIIFLSLP